MFHCMRPRSVLAVLALLCSAALGLAALVPAQAATPAIPIPSDPRDLLNFTGDNAELADEIVTGAAEYLEELREMTSSFDGSPAAQGDAAEILKSAEDLANRLAGKKISVTPDEAPEGGVNVDLPIQLSPDPGPIESPIEEE